MPFSMMSLTDDPVQYQVTGNLRGNTDRLFVNTAFAKTRLQFGQVKNYPVQSFDILIEN